MQEVLLCLVHLLRPVLRSHQSNISDWMINGLGAYSLSDSTIQSKGDISVTFTGYKSGQNAKVICHDGDVCDVSCSGVSACGTMECIGAGCNVVYTYNSSTGNVFEYDAFDLLTRKDAECNENGALSFDDAQEHNDAGTVIANSIVCCRGSESCSQSEGISASGNSVICGGDSGCALDGIIIADELVCSGQNSCKGAVIISRTIYCIGFRSCDESTINIQHTGFLDCGAEASCASADIQSPGNNAVVTMQFTGFASLSSTNITCKDTVCNIFVLAEQSASVNFVSSVVCLGECNIECPQEFYCPGLVHMYGNFCCTYIRYPCTCVQFKVSFLEHRPNFQLRIHQLSPQIIQALNHLMTQPKIHLIQLSQPNFPPIYHHQLQQVLLSILSVTHPRNDQMI